MGDKNGEEEVHARVQFVEAEQFVRCMEAELAEEKAVGAPRDMVGIGGGAQGSVLRLVCAPFSGADAACGEEVDLGLYDAESKKKRAEEGI